ncbi:hypothetical protein [Methylorubrum sp. SB2]|uniref:DUF7241 domain-containing protein n=1 Tax=Methylorubrum subtropicum TaxID=3138812 RepID=UPI00313C5505
MKHSSETTRHDHRPAAEICRAHGWGEGTRLVGRDAVGTTVIEITALGPRVMLARTVSQDHRPAAYGQDRSWRLSDRDWREVA